ncbi:hypothetical protein BHM03_00014211 [Ensete ventricosum]|nr:hypothetical protein BHM03_00014211 [Ensete ventricosum]
MDRGVTRIDDRIEEAHHRSDRLIRLAEIARLKGLHDHGSIQSKGSERINEKTVREGQRVQDLGFTKDRSTLEQALSAALRRREGGGEGSCSSISSRLSSPEGLSAAIPTTPAGEQRERSVREIPIRLLASRTRSHTFLFGLLSHSRTPRRPRSPAPGKGEADPHRRLRRFLLLLRFWVRYGALHPLLKPNRFDACDSCFKSLLVLSDDEKRSLYDKYGEAGLKGAGMGMGVYPVLKRDGTNILYTCKVSYIDAILGTTTKVPTVDGVVDLKIPAGTQPGTTLVMAKKGVPYLGKPNTRGDQLVRVQVEIPKSLSTEEKKLIEELANLSKAKTANSRR